MSDFPTMYQRVIYKRTYSRWDYLNKRRETWTETVNRYIHAMQSKVVDSNFNEGAEAFLLSELDAAREMILESGVMGSMRAMWTAGPALDKENACAFNCAYTPIETLKDFADVFYLLLCGCGVSYSCERQVIASLPRIPMITDSPNLSIKFEDSKEGWAKGYWELLIALFMQGTVPHCDLSAIRPKGAILKTFGGRASGPEPLLDLIKFTVRLLKQNQDSKITSAQVSDLICKIADTVVVGGTRRSATLALTNPSDRRMAEYKKGDWWIDYGHRALVNVSSCYTEKPDPIMFMEDMLHLIESKSGERGFVNRESMIKDLVSAGRDKNTQPEVIKKSGVNPCGEIILLPRQFCNLSEIIVRPDDDLNDLIIKARLATTLGFIQSLFNDFNFIDKRWEQNALDDRILGVSLTGLRDHPQLSYVNDEAVYILQKLRSICHAREHYLATLCEIPPAKAITCVKPSGTVSQLVNSASGLHVRYAEYYIRRVRIASNDPLAKLLVAQGVPYQPENGETMENARTWVFEFPMKSPENARTKAMVNAIEQLEYWKMLKTYWTDHNPSCTVYVKEHEWVRVAAWVYDNFDIIGGISFLPDDNTYTLAPYEEITEEQYKLLVGTMPKVDLSELSTYEQEDYTQGAGEVACNGGACEL